MNSLKHIRLEHLPHGVKKMVLVRPDICNAFHAEMIAEISNTLSELAAIPEAENMRLLVLEGEGNIFCAGADLNYMKEQAKSGEEQNLKDARVLGQMFYKLASFPTTVLCAVKGTAVGGGLGLVSCCDIVLAEDRAQFAASEVLLGLVAGVISPYVIRKLGPARAGHMMLTGKRVSAHDALHMGLVQQVVPTDSFAAAIKQNILDCLKVGPNAARGSKRLLHKCAPLPDAELFEYCAQQIAKARASAEAQLGLECFFAKKAPTWSVRDIP